MSGLWNQAALDPRTRADIWAQCDSDFAVIPEAMKADRVIDRLCGCRTVPPGTPARWVVCDYHEGYDAALEQHCTQQDLDPDVVSQVQHLVNEYGKRGIEKVLRVVKP